jgi:hypothetical protein
VSNERQLRPSLIVPPDDGDLDRFRRRRLADRVGEQPAGKPWRLPNQFGRAGSRPIGPGRIALLSCQLRHRSQGMDCGAQPGWGGVVSRILRPGV